MDLAPSDTWAKLIGAWIFYRFRPKLPNDTACLDNSDWSGEKRCYPLPSGLSWDCRLIMAGCVAN